MTLFANKITVLITFLRLGQNTLHTLVMVIVSSWWLLGGKVWWEGLAWQSGSTERKGGWEGGRTLPGHTPGINDLMSPPGPSPKGSLL